MEEFQNNTMLNEINNRKNHNIHGLVRILDVCPNVMVDLQYFGPNNFFQKALYDSPEAWILAETACKLQRASGNAEQKGFILVILDAYRPLSVQQTMWDILPDSNFVAPMTRGSIHNRGAAVDVTLADTSRTPVPMPSQFDEFSERASHTYQEGPPECLANREQLRAIMENAGFTAYNAEWWHYTDSDQKHRPLIDVPLSELG